MNITPAIEKYFRSKLPIDQDETIIAVYRRHPVVYFLPVLAAIFTVLIVSGLAYLLVYYNADETAVVPANYRSLVVLGVGIFSFLVLLFTYIPVWMKMQDRLVLTNESVLQILQTSLFSDKVSQLSLQHVADVTVRAGFWGNMLGFGTLTIETPGEQANYQFSYLPDANTAAREISEAHENFIAALESGELYDHSHPSQSPRGQQPIMIDPAQYQEFLRYQQQTAANQTQPPADTPPQSPIL